LCQKKREEPAYMGSENTYAAGVNQYVLTATERDRLHVKANPTPYSRGCVFMWVVEVREVRQ